MTGRVCSSPHCHLAGVPQPLENFHKTKGRCKPCQSRDARAARQRSLERRNQSGKAVDWEFNELLPIGPLRTWLRRQIALVGDLGEFARLMERDSNDQRMGRRVYAWLHESKYVRLDALDRALCNYGQPGVLREIYPHLYVTCPECKRTGTHNADCSVRVSALTARARLIRNAEDHESVENAASSEQAA